MKKSVLFEQNLETIKNCDELLYLPLSDINLENHEINNTKVEVAADDNKIINLIQGQYEWSFNSKYASKTIAKAWADNLGKIESIATIVMFGLGNGQILKELLSSTPKSVFFIIYEPSANLFLQAMNEIDFSFLEDRVFLLVEGINDACVEMVLNAFVTYENLSVCKFVGHPNYFTCFQEESKDYLSRLQTFIKYIDINKNTRIKMAEGYYKNALMNIKHLDNASVLDQVKGKVGTEIPENLPAIIVSAGPSLSKNIKELKRAKRKAFLIATDSALIGLLAEGIIPDAFITIDPLKPMNRFQDERIDEIPLISTETARFELLEKHKDKKILANNEFGYGHAFYQGQDLSYQLEDYGGSVATFAYAVTKAMGFKTIIFVGQDLAFTDDTRYYDQVKKWSDHTVRSNTSYIEVEDIYGNMVKTSGDLVCYIEWFETQVKADKEIKVIDATEGGAKIRGTMIQTLSETITEECNIGFDMTEYLRSISPYSKVEQKDFELFLQKVMNAYKKLYRDVINGISLYAKLIKMLQSKQKDTSKMLKLTKDIGKTTQSIERNMVHFHIQYKITKVEYEVLNNLGISESEQVEDAIQTASRGKIILDALKVILEEEVLPEIEKVLGKK